MESHQNSAIYWTFKQRWTHRASSQHRKIAAERTARDDDAVDSDIRSHLTSLADQIETASEEEKLELANQLQDCRFIYIPDATPPFRTPEKVSWSDGLGEFVVPISTYYRGLKELLVNIIGIPPEPTLNRYIEFLATAEDERWSDIEDAWREIIRRIVSNDSPDRTHTEFATKLAEVDLIPNANESVVPYEHIEYLVKREGMSEGLPESIASTVALPSYDQRFDRDEIISSLEKLLDAELLSEALEQTITNPPYEPRDQPLHEQFTSELDVGYSILLNRDEPEAADQLATVAGYSFQLASQITCEYHINGEQYPQQQEKTVHIDKNQEHVFIQDTDRARLDLVDALAATLDLTGADKNIFIEYVKGAIGKQPDLIDAYLNGDEISPASLDSKPPVAEDSQPEANNTDEEGASDDEPNEEVTQDPKQVDNLDEGKMI